jgi:hypothetical protein
MVFAHPRGHKWDQREPKQQMKIRPQDSSVYVVDRMQQVMMIGPVDSYVCETEQLA